MLWVNKSCSANRMATTIKARNKKVCYMYIGGGALDPVVSKLLYGLAIVCQNWKWAAFAHAAARVAGHACANDLGAFSESLVLSGENAEEDAASALGSASTSFIRHCEET